MNKFGSVQFSSLVCVREFRLISFLFLRRLRLLDEYKKPRSFFSELCSCLRKTMLTNFLVFEFIFITVNLRFILTFSVDSGFFVCVYQCLFHYFSRYQKLTHECTERMLPFIWQRGVYIRQKGPSNVFLSKQYILMFNFIYLSCMCNAIAQQRHEAAR